MDYTIAFKTKFEEWLDKEYPFICIDGGFHPPSTVYPRVDPVCYEELFDKWLKENGHDK